MYNRYVPQSDGTYQRSRMPDSPPRQPAAHQPPQNPPCPPAPAEAGACPGANMPCLPPEPRRVPPRCPKAQRKAAEGSVAGFLRQLLPSNFDTADLIVVLLLLLMSGDCPEDQNTALLTLALYLFL